MKELLRFLNEGRPPTDEEVEFVVQRCASSGAFFCEQAVAAVEFGNDRRGRVVACPISLPFPTRADENRNGQIELCELRAAVALWYLHVTKKLEQQQQLKEINIKNVSSWCCGRG